MDMAVREWTHWAAGYGLPRASLKLLPSRGDPLGRLLRIDSDPVDDIYPLIEQVRGRGRMSPALGVKSLFERFPQLTLVGEPTFNNSIGLHGLKHLPVSLRAAQPIRSTH